METAAQCGRLRICRIYFYAGLAFLPFFWLVNSIWFFRDAFLSESTPDRRQFRLFVSLSIVGALLWFAGLLTWNLIYQSYRPSWGELELLQIEGVVCSVKQPVQRDKNNILISSKLKVMEQVFICKAVIDRLLGEASSKIDTQTDNDELFLWIHGVGVGAIDRAIEVAHNLSTKFFPNQLKVFLFTENLDLSEELIRVNKAGEVIERENRTTKPAIHIPLTDAFRQHIMAAMTSLNSSIVFWNEVEIIPRSILLISSGAGGDRLLFWHPVVASHSGNSQKVSTASCGEREQTKPKSSNETVGASQRLKQTSEIFPAASHPQPSAHAPHKGRSPLPPPSLDSIPLLAGCPPVVTAVVSAPPSANPHSTVLAGSGVGGGGQVGHLSNSVSSTVVGSPSQLGVSPAMEASAPDMFTSMGRSSVPACSSTASTAEMLVEGMPVSSLLSLLHPSTQQMQHKIYVKVDR
ncbi:hypothetical protein AAHC03_09926 [Spirometra sp. Aus1]